MFGLDTGGLARAINNDISSVVRGMQGSRPPVAEPAADWAGFARNLTDPRTARVAPTNSGMRPASAAASAPMPFAPASSAATATLAGTGDQRAAALALARAMFGDEGERQLNTTFDVEGGWNGEVGDRDLSPVGSYGPLQFYGGGGQLNNFAAAKGIGDLMEAGRYVLANPLEAVRWALNNYYGNALREGLDQRLTGEELAEYIQRHGQRSRNPERARDTYRRLYG